MQSALTWCLAGCLSFMAAAESDGAAAPVLVTPPDLLDDTPEDFPRFCFSGNDDDAAWLGRYLWYHFKNRGGAGPTLFNQEYLSTADYWMGGAFHPSFPDRVIQQIHRDNLTRIHIDPEGYVSTHQHFSHAHENGWPFPMWTQCLTGPEGYTAGWHFQQDGHGWVWDTLRNMPGTWWAREEATQGWTLHGLRSEGLKNNRWNLVATDTRASLDTPVHARIEAFCAPFLQLRWLRSAEPPQGVLPSIEWLREGDTDFSPERRVYFATDNGNPDYEAATGTQHALIAMHRHPLWDGFIRQIRINLEPAAPGDTFEIDSFFTVFDTRHSINNPIYILASWDYFRWTGDLAFLRQMINPMRNALRYQQTEMGGLKYNHIRNTWVGHNGLPGFSVKPDGSKEMRYGHGIGNNYWDLLPCGWDDMYATSQYYAATMVMADIEEAILENPGWSIPVGAGAMDPAMLREHARHIRDTANEKFWNPSDKRFYACIDINGGAHDYGFTFLNLDAIWYGIASDQHARDIMEWLDGRRIIDGDTSTGKDIYHWRFGPRATTRRNIEWYGHGWTAPESIPWGGQVQDGGAVLGFSFYDLWARLHVFGPENAWKRLQETLAWEREVWSQGGYRPYYEGGKQGTTLQGGGTAGGLGIDFEFWESSLVPAIVPLGFLGLRPTADCLAIGPHLPESCPEMGIANLLYRNVRLDVLAKPDAITIAVKDTPREPLHLSLENGWTRSDTGESGPTFLLDAARTYAFTR